MSSPNYGAFWSLNFSDLVVNAGKGTLNCRVDNLPALDARFSIVKDDTGADVLLVNSYSPVTLSMAASGVGYSLVSVMPVEFIGNKPHRPTIE